MSRIYLSANDKIEKFENHLVKVTLTDGTVFEGLEPRRLFPVSNPTAYVTLLDADGEPVAVGEVGEICINVKNGAPCGLFKGYYLDEE